MGALRPKKNGRPAVRFDSPRALNEFYGRDQSSIYIRSTQYATRPKCVPHCCTAVGVAHRHSTGIRVFFAWHVHYKRSSRERVVWGGGGGENFDFAILRLRDISCFFFENRSHLTTLISDIHTPRKFRSAIELLSSLCVFCLVGFFFSNGKRTNVIICRLKLTAE